MENGGIGSSNKRTNKKYCEAFVYKAGFTLTQDSPGVVCRPALLRKTNENVEYDKLLEAALAILGDKYFDIMEPVLGPRGILHMFLQPRPSSPP